MQKTAFETFLTGYETASPEERDPAVLADCFALYAATSAADKQTLAERVWALLVADKAPDAALTRFAEGFSAADTLRQVASGRSRTGQLSHVSSIRTQLMLRARKSLLSDKLACPEYVVQHKQTAFLFADILGVRRPVTLAERQQIDQIDYVSGIALKPPRGRASNGVYLLRDKDTAVDVRQGAVLPGRREVRDAMRDDIVQKRVPLDVWNVEELIIDDSTDSGLPNDWNFHCFYGEIMRMGHIQRFPERMNYGLDHEMRPTRWFQIDPTVAQDSTPRRPPPAFLELARRISLALPAPYVRVDLMTSNEGPVLIELTARPGVLHRYDARTDRILGEAMMRAEVRLETDLRQGKRFEAYDALLVERERQIQAAQAAETAAGDDGASAPQQDAPAPRRARASARKRGRKKG